MLSLRYVLWQWRPLSFCSCIGNGGLRPDTEVLCPALPNDQYRSGVDFAGMRLEYVAGVGLLVSMSKASFSLEAGRRRGGFRCFLGVGQIQAAMSSHGGTVDCIR